MIARTRTPRPIAALAVAAVVAIVTAAPEGAALAAANSQNPTATGVPSATVPATGTQTAPPASRFGAPGSTTATPPALAAGSPLSNAAPARTAAKKSSGRRISTEAAIIAALGALLVLGAAAWALARRFAYEPAWWLGMRHSFAEASFRTSATWAELRDWARIGR